MDLIEFEERRTLIGARVDGERGLRGRGRCTGRGPQRGAADAAHDEADDDEPAQDRGTADGSDRLRKERAEAGHEAGTPMTAISLIAASSNGLPG